VSDAPPPPPASFGQPAPGSGPDVGTALSYGWNKFTQNAGVLIAVIVIPFLVQLVFNAIGFAVQSSVAYILLGLIGLVVSAALNIGIFNTALMITRGETPTVGKAFTSDRWGEWILFSIVFQLFVGIGLAFCIIPGLLILAFFGLAPYYFLDQNKSLGDAFSASLEATRSRQGLPLAIGLTVLVGILGVIACYVGLLVTLPLAYVAVGFLYRAANGQQAAA
jgi:hypothetical protein